MGQNPQEQFDVVDADDRVVRQAPRHEVHAQGWRHRAVHVWVRNAAGQLFLQKRSRTKDMSPGLWDSSCSGHLDAGEEYDAAAHRELGEELGLFLPAPPRRWRRFEACADTGNEFMWVYQVTAEGPFRLHPGEIERGEWVAPAELAQRLAADPEAYCTAFRLIWRTLGAELFKR